MVGKTPKVHRRSDHTVNPQQPTLSRSLVMVGKTTMVHQRSNHHQQTLSRPPITVTKTPKLQVELPLHLVVSLILTRLPVKTLSRFRCVSKPLRSLISEPHFRKEHAHRCQQIPLLLIAEYDTTAVRFSTYSIHGEQILKDFSISFAEPILRRSPQGTLQLVQSCLGLVCLRTVYDGAILVFNPITEEVITLPERPRQNWDQCIGFGYTDFSDEFKVVRFFIEKNVFEDDDSDSNFDYSAFYNRKKCFSEVFTLGSSDGWRETRSPPFKPSWRAHLPLVHGALHFLPSLYHHRNMRDDHYISAFDVHTEQYRGIPLPEIYVGFQGSLQCALVELRGSLCMSFDFLKSKNLLQLWFLKDYHGGKWVKEYSIDLSRVKEYNFDLSRRPMLFPTFVVMHDDWVLLNFASSEGRKMCYYNTKKNCIEKTVGYNCSALLYVDSFLTPFGNRSGRCTITD